MLKLRTIRRVTQVLALISFICSSVAQEIPIPDPGLNAAVRDALLKPTGPLTEADLLGLTNLLAGGRSITNVAGLEAARNLRILDLDNNLITTFPIAGALTNLTILDLFGNDLASFALTTPLSKLTILDLAFNSLTQCSLPAGLSNLNTLFLEHNALTNFTLPTGLTGLAQLDLGDNQLTNLTLPPEVINLTALFLTGNPLMTLVLSEPLAATNLAPTISNLQNQGVQVFTYPLAVQLTFPGQQPIGAFRFGLTGPPGVYTVYSSTDLTAWEPLNFVNNPLGHIFFTDVEAHLAPRKFYRALLQSPPANMVFISRNTFTMGSPPTEQDRDPNEGPQTTVTLTRGFWMGKYEVTQAEYLSVTGTNPSQFPGDPSRPVSSVSWPDATNYCWLLTQQELAAGRISPGSRYRLPTEAEWECAARAGTTNRFSYGDDPNYTSLTNYAWQNFEDGITVHPVGQKLPNPWGLYDMMGNVFEWCQDWLGPLPGGAVTDPQGPPSNPIAWKVMRGGAFDFGFSACRSASRNSFANHPALTDANLGFRVVLVSDL